MLSIGETVQEVEDSNFRKDCSTLATALLANNNLVQVHANGIRLIRAGGQPTEWKPPGNKTIESAAANSRQVAISLPGGEIIYFELDAADQLQERGRVGAHPLEIETQSCGCTASLDGAPPTGQDCLGARGRRHHLHG